MTTVMSVQGPILETPISLLKNIANIGTDWLRQITD